MDESQSQQVTPAGFVFVEGANPVALGNVFAVAQLQDEFLIVIGQAAPQLAGTVQDGNIISSQGQTLPIRTVAQFMLTESRMQQLIDNLRDALTNAKKAKEGKE